MNIHTKALKLISLDGKVAMITGAASGIGLGTAKRFVEVGSKVALLDIDKSNGRTAEEEIKNLGGHAKFFHYNVATNADCKKATEGVIKNSGKSIFF